MRLLRSALIVVLAAGAVDAQPVARRADPRPADTVRVWAEAPTLSGRLGVVRRVTADSLILGMQAAGAPRLYLDMPISAAAVRRIDVMTGRGPNQGRAFASTIGGVVLGGLAGGFVGNAREPEICDAGCEAAGGARHEFRGGTTILGALLGAGVGAIVGAYLGSQPVAKWSRIW